MPFQRQQRWNCLFIFRWFRGSIGAGPMGTRSVGSNGLLLREGRQVPSQEHLGGICIAGHSKESQRQEEIEGQHSIWRALGCF